VSDHNETIERLRKLSDKLDAAKKASEETTKEIEQAQRTQGGIERVLVAPHMPPARKKRPASRKARRKKRR
jgi:hypothetical protein